MKSTRRAFVRGAVAVSAVPLSALALGKKPTEAKPPAPADGLTRLARERYGKFLTTNQLAALDERMGSLSQTSERLRAFKLANGDEPACDFRVVRR
jgi:hypothetical protein